MRRYLLDTNIAGHYMSRRRGVYERTRAEVAAGNHVGVCVPVVAELSYGVEFSATRDRNRQRLQLLLSHLVVWPFDLNAALEYGRIATDLRRVGRPMQPVDIMVAAVAFTLGKCVVVTADSDLSAVPGLSVENWAESSAGG